MGRRLRALYGAGPLNLLVLVASFAIAAAAVAGWFQRSRDVVTVLEWFVAAFLLHDLVALPLYTLLDRVAFGALGSVTRRSGPELVSPTPFLRIPAILSGLLFLVFLPVMFGLGAGTERSASDITEHGYAGRWLLATGVMFVLSGVLYALALGRARAARENGVSEEPGASDPPARPG